MSKKQNTEDVNAAPAISAEATPNEYVFDFTLDERVMEPHVREAYYRIYHIALIRGDNALVPDGKVMTLPEVERIIGELGDLKVARTCCA